MEHTREKTVRAFLDPHQPQEPTAEAAGEAAGALAVAAGRGVG